MFAMLALIRPMKTLVYTSVASLPLLQYSLGEAQVGLIPVVWVEDFQFPAGELQGFALHLDGGCGPISEGRITCRHTSRPPLLSDADTSSVM